MNIISFQILVDVLGGMHSNPTPSPIRTGRHLDAGRAYILLILILMVLKSQSEKQCEKPTPPECKDDCDGKKWLPAIHPANSTATCQPYATLIPCTQLECPPGFRLDRDCDEGINARCVPVCKQEEFFDTLSNRCSPCRFCDNTDEDIECTGTSDRICGRCKTGYYHMQGTPDLCHPCSDLMQPELEPQCQTSGTTKLPNGVATSESTSSILPSTEAPLTEVDDGKSFTLSSTHTKFQGMDPTTGKMSPSPGDDGLNFFGEPSPENIENKETDKEATSGVSTYVVLLLVISALILILIVAFIVWPALKKRHGRITRLRREQQRSFISYLQQTPAEEGSASQDPEGGVDINWQGGSVRYHRDKARRALHKDPESTHLLMRPPDRQGDRESLFSVNTSLMEEDDMPATLRSFDERASSFENTERSKTINERPTKLLDDISAPFQSEDTSAALKNNASKEQSKTPEANGVMFNQEATVYKHQEVRIEAATGSEAKEPQVEEPQAEEPQAQESQAASSTEQVLTAVEGKPRKDAEGQKQVEPEATICKPQAMQTESVKCSRRKKSHTSTSKDEANPKPTTNINIVCKGKRNKINVQYGSSGNSSPSDSETETESDSA